jgi:hypothetical protein
VHKYHNCQIRKTEIFVGAKVSEKKKRGVKTKMVAVASLRGKLLKKINLKQVHKKLKYLLLVDS